MLQDALDDGRGVGGVVGVGRAGGGGVGGYGVAFISSSSSRRGGSLHLLLLFALHGQRTSLLESVAVIMDTLDVSNLEVAIRGADEGRDVSGDMGEVGVCVLDGESEIVAGFGVVAG